jgi:DNA-directed RNA polymerase subunit RPC12/RpoP/DNA-binding transcriptional regulator YhcF (GntR family)
MSNQGFIKLDRGIVDHWVFQKDPELRIFVYLINLAKYSNNQKPVVIGKQQRVLDRGEFISSIGKIAEKLDLKHNQVRRVLDLFKNCDMIKKTAGRGKNIPYVAKIVNYDKYQGIYTIKEQSKHNQSTFKMQHTNNYNNYNNGYNEKLYIYKCEVCETILQNETTITDLDITCPTCNVASIRHLV